MSPKLLLLLVELPPAPSSLRVRVWRRLRSLGAIALKRSAYMLPDTPDCYEDFQWLAQEIDHDGGEATLVRVHEIENISSQEVMRRLHEPRENDYKRLAAQYRKLLLSIDKKPKANRSLPKELATLAREHERIRNIDFFQAPGDPEVVRLQEAIAKRLRAPKTTRRTARRILDLSRLRGRRWATRPRPHIDRIASAWLIKKFIDPDARFVFATPSDFPEDAIPFDTPGAELSHQGEDCTFETLLKCARLRDRRLVRLAEVVHQADLHDGKYRHEEARGIELSVRALLASSADDHQVLAQGMLLFDGLYAMTSPKARRSQKTSAQDAVKR